MKLQKIYFKAGLFRSSMIVAAAVGVSACSSIVEGTSQQVLVNTNPAGADCVLEREGFTIGRVDPTPGSALVDKTKHDITIKCNMDTFHEATYINKSDIAGATFGNIVLGGGIGWIIDSASGADNKYTSPANITMVPLTQPVPPVQKSPNSHEDKDAEPSKPVS